MDNSSERSTNVESELESELPSRSLAEELAMCPAPSEHEPAWDQNSMVTPRAFLSEYGYDLPGEQLPNSLGKFLIRTEHCEPVRTYIRTFESPSDGEAPGQGSGSGHTEQSPATTSTYNSGPASTAGQVQDESLRPPGTPADPDAKNMIQTYRILDEAERDVSVDRHGGVLVRYQYPRSGQYIKETGHQAVGFYWIGLQTAHELEHKLINGPNEGPWADDNESEDDVAPLPTLNEFVGRNREWADKPNPAARESWAVISRIGDSSEPS